MLSYMAAVVVAICAWRGLHQVTLLRQQMELTKDIAGTAAKREAFKLAAEQCKVFADQLVPLFKEVRNAYIAKKVDLKLFPFAIADGEIVGLKLHGDVQKVADAYGSEGLMYLNAAEAFSMFFVNGIADETVAFRETGVTFCRSIALSMPAIVAYRERQGVRFESTVKLYEIWQTRLEKEALLKSKASIDSALQAKPDVKIKTIGAE
jgi:hypothetical protein